jgi:hypothetical protein
VVPELGGVARLVLDVQQRLQPLVPSARQLAVLAALYSQCAATPASATRCISSVRIWNSTLMPEGPTSVVCSDW